MTDGGCNNSAQNDVVELEAMRRDTFSWHPCQIALCSRGLGLIVVYGDSNFEETITDKEEIFERLRVRSIPLQGDDCSLIKQGEHLLATKISRVKGVFYDARVEEAFHVRHSKRIHCRCSFRIKWLHEVNEKEAVTVPSSSIMKLSTKSIHLHPTISTFFGMMETPNDLDETTCPMIVDGMNSEMDISVLLEKQIKEISNSTDISREKISTGFVFGQVDFKGQSNSQTIEASLKGPCFMFPFLDKLKGSNGNENKQHTETTVEIPPVCIPSVEEKITGSRFLSPLAARAALASSRSEFLHSPQFGESIVKKLFPTSDDPQIVEVSKLSPRAQVNEMDKQKKIKEKMISQPSNSRFTRAQAQKNNVQIESTQMTNTNGTPLMVTKARRVTRSTVERAEKIEVKEYNAAVDDNAHAECTKVVASPVDGETSECSDNDEHSLLGKDEVVVTDDLQNGTFVQNAEKQNYPKRLTRSAARSGVEKVNVQSSQTKSEKINVQPKRKQRKSSSPESHKVDLCKEDVIVDTNTLEPEEREKNRKACIRDKSTPKRSESGVGSYQSRRQMCSSSKKQDTRFTPRLTRSQSKA